MNKWAMPLYTTHFFYLAIDSVYNSCSIYMIHHGYFFPSWIILHWISWNYEINRTESKMSPGLFQSCFGKLCLIVFASTLPPSDRRQNSIRYQTAQRSLCFLFTSEEFAMEIENFNWAPKPKQKSRNRACYSKFKM